MNPEISELTRSFLLEHVNQHDVNHGFHQNIRSVRPHIGYLFGPSGIVIILFHTELQIERVRQYQAFARRIVSQLPAE